MRLVVECAGDHPFGGERRQPGDLGAHLVHRTAADESDVGVGLGLELDDLGLEACPSVDEQGGGALVGLGEQLGPLALDVALGLADAGGFGDGLVLVLSSGVELGLDTCRAPVERLLDQR